MRTSKRRPRHSLPFGLFLAVVGALLLPAVLAPRASAGSASTDSWDFEYPMGLRPSPAPELLSQPQGVLTNQPLGFNYNPTLALNVAPGEQPGGSQPFQVDALFSWTGATSTTWSDSVNWSPAGPPTGADTAVFNGAFSNQPSTGNVAITPVGELLMTTGVAQNVTLSGSVALTINGVAGIGILINNPNAFTLTISAPLVVAAAQAWTNNSGNLFTKTGTVALGGNALTVNGTGNTTIAGVLSGTGGSITKDGTGTLIVTAFNSYTGGTTVNGGTLLVNGSGNLGTGAVTVNNSGTLGGNSTFAITPPGIG